MMNSTNKLSVIIPLYNAGDDFRTCMESLITQTWTALEIIIINDGSTDISVEIAKHYAENYPQSWDRGGDGQICRFCRC